MIKRNWFSTEDISLYKLCTPRIGIQNKTETTFKKSFVYFMLLQS